MLGYPESITMQWCHSPSPLGPSLPLSHSPCNDNAMPHPCPLPPWLDNHNAMNDVMAWLHDTTSSLVFQSPVTDWQKDWQLYWMQQDATKLQLPVLAKPWLVTVTVALLLCRCKDWLPLNLEILLFIYTSYYNSTECLLYVWMGGGHSIIISSSLSSPNGKGRTTHWWSIVVVLSTSRERWEGEGEGDTLTLSVLCCWTYRILFIISKKYKKKKKKKNMSEAAHW